MTNTGKESDGDHFRMKGVDSWLDWKMIYTKSLTSFGLELIALVVDFQSLSTPLLFRLKTQSIRFNWDKVEAAFDESLGQTHLKFFFSQATRFGSILPIFVFLEKNESKSKLRSWAFDI